MHSTQTGWRGVKGGVLYTRISGSLKIILRTKHALLINLLDGQLDLGAVRKLYVKIVITVENVKLLKILKFIKLRNMGG